MKNIVLILFLILYAQQAASSQIKIEFNTPIADTSLNKHSIAIGIIGFLLDNADWVQVVKFDEKYALFLKNIKVETNYYNPKITNVSFRLELRTPNKNGYSTRLDTVQVHYEYNSEEMLPIDSIAKLESAILKLNDELIHARIDSTFLKFIRRYPPETIAKTIPKVSLRYPSSFKQNQKNMGILGGYYTTIYLYGMLKKQNAL